MFGKKVFPKCLVVLLWDIMAYEKQLCRVTLKIVYGLSVFVLEGEEGGVDHGIMICGLGFSIQFLLWCCHLKVCLENRKILEVFCIFKRYGCKANIEAKPRLFCSIVWYDVVCHFTSSDIFQWYCKLGLSLWITWHATSISIPAYHPLI